MTKLESLEKKPGENSGNSLEPGIYRYEKRIELAVRDIKASSKTIPVRIIPENRDVILRYLTFLRGSGRSLARQDKLLRTVK
jgi:hypothetical protein